MAKSELRLSLAKCWQGKEPWLCFQATVTEMAEGTVMRHRGYLIADARRGKNPLAWKSEKPDDLLPNGGGCANLVRKFLSSAHVAGLALGTSEKPDAFVSILLLTQVSGESTQNLDKQTAPYVLTISNRTPPELELVGPDLKSLFRWNEKGLFTVRKTSDGLDLILQEFLRTPTIEHIHRVTASSLTLVLNEWIHPESLSQGDNKLPTETQDQPVPHETLPLHQRQARDRVARRIKTLQKTITQDQSRIPTVHALKAAQREADLLKAWMHAVQPESFELALSPEQAGTSEVLSINLSPELSPGENLNRKFHDLRRSERAFELGTKRLASLETQLQQLKTTLEILRSPAPLNEERCTALLVAVGLAAQQREVPSPLTSKAGASDKPPAVGRLFRSADGALMHLGRTAKENDSITKAAKSNDWWFHSAGGVHGTHVIVPKRSVKGGKISEGTEREAMILALHFSTLALSRSGEVYVTTRGFLKKRKGMPDGLWQIERSKTLKIQYEEGELSAIFAREIRRGVLRHGSP